MSLLLLFNQAAAPVTPGTVAGGWIGNRRDSYDYDELDRLYDEWKRSKNKKVKKVVVEAIEALQIADAKGILGLLEPAVELQASIEAFPSKPIALQIEQIRSMTEQLLRALDDEDDDDVLMLALSLS